MTGAIREPALHGRFLRGLALGPERVAVRVGGDALTYAEVHETALRWAGSLLAATGEPLRAVGVLAAGTMTAYTGVIAALYAGAAVVPLQPEYPMSRTRHMIDVSGASAVIADRRGTAVLAEAAGTLPGLAVLAPDGGREVPPPIRDVHVRDVDALPRPRPVSSDDTACVFFTSGSTGQPKGVPITHGGTAHYFGLVDSRYDFDSRDVFSQSFDLTFDCALFDLFGAWGVGATAVRVPTAAYGDLAGFCARNGITVWFSTPSVIRFVRRLGRLSPGSLPGLRWSLFAGEALRCSDAVDWARAAPRSSLENLYGPTELTITVTAHRWSPRESERLSVNGVVPIGRLHAGHDHLLLGTSGEAVTAEGELCVTGPQMTTGYAGRGGDTNRFLVRDGRTWYRTGDRVRRLPNGEFAYLGRDDTQIQLGGRRVEVGEIEHALRGCAAVEEAVIVAVTSDGGCELVVFYTGTAVPAAELAAGLRRVLPGELVPRHYRHLDRLPLNGNRKIDRLILRSQAVDVLDGSVGSSAEGEWH